MTHSGDDADYAPIYSDDEQDDQYNINDNENEESDDEYIPTVSQSRARLSTKSSSKKVKKRSSKVKSPSKKTKANPVTKEPGSKNIQEEEEETSLEMRASLLANCIRYIIFQQRSNLLITRTDLRNSVSTQLSEIKDVQAKIKDLIDQQAPGIVVNLDRIFGFSVHQMERFEKKKSKGKNKSGPSKKNPASATAESAPNDEEGEPGAETPIDAMESTNKALQKLREKNEVNTTEQLSDLKLPPKFILLNSVKIRPEFRDQYHSIIQSPSSHDDSNNSLLIIVLTLIQINGANILEPDLFHFLEPLLGKPPATESVDNAYSNKKHPIFGSLKQLLRLWTRQYYLTASDFQTRGGKTTEYRWGPRAYLTMPLDRLYMYVSSLFGKDNASLTIDELAATNHLFTVNAQPVLPHGTNVSNILKKQST